jgi:hypothetical protein
VSDITGILDDWSLMAMTNEGSGATGRNGGHLAKNLFKGFGKREQLFGRENTRKMYELEDYVVSSIVRIVQEQGWTGEVDLVDGRHVTVFLEEEEERIARGDYEDAKRGGLELSGVEFLDRRTMSEVGCLI